MESLIQSLNKINQSLPFSVPSKFQSYPKSLKEMIRIMNLPNPDLHTLHNRMVHDFSAEDAQGITYAYDNNWFLTSQHKIYKYRVEGSDLYSNPRFTRVISKRLENIILDIGLEPYFWEYTPQGPQRLRTYDHLGDLDYFNGLLFIPIRSKDKNDKSHILVALDINLNVIAYARFNSSTNDAWCAINPWNQYLYASPNDSDTKLHAYNVSVFYAALNDPNTWGNQVYIGIDINRQFNFFKLDGSPDQVRNIQGALFSPNGRLYIAEADEVWNGWNGWNNYIHVYNALTGKQLNSPLYKDFPGSFDEIEGLTYHPSGIIYVVVADNDGIGSDEFEIHAFKYSDASFPI